MTTMRKFQLFLLIISITSGTKAKTAIARDVPANRGPSYQQHAQKALSPVLPRKMISSRNTSESIQINSNIGQIISSENSGDEKTVEISSKLITPVSLTALQNDLPLATHVPPSEIFRFELSDAAIPNKETAELINQGRVRLSKNEMGQQEHQTDHQRDLFTEESRASHQIQAATQNVPPKIISHENRKAKSISEIGYSNQAHTLPRYGFVRYQAVPVKLFNPNQKENSHQQWWKQPAKHVSSYKSYRPAFKPFSPSMEYPKASSNTKYQTNNLYEYKFESPPSKATQYSQNSQYEGNSFKPSSYDNLYHNPIPFVIEVPDKKLEYTATNYLHSQTEALTQLIGKPPTQQLLGLSNLLQYDQPQRQQDSTAPVLFPLGARLPKPKENQTESILKVVDAPVQVPQEEPLSYTLVPFYLQEDQKPIIEESMEEEVTNVHQPILPSIPVEVPAPQDPVLIFHELSPLQKDLNKPYASGYKFGYRVRDHHTGNDFGHTQNRDTDGVTRGEYHTLLPDGRLQTVWYTADKKGFHADVSYNGEPPTKHADG